MKIDFLYENTFKYIIDVESSLFINNIGIFASGKQLV